MKKLFLLVALLAYAGASAQDGKSAQNTNFQEIGATTSLPHWRSTSPDTQFKAADNGITLFAVEGKQRQLQALKLESGVRMSSAAKSKPTLRPKPRHTLNQS